MIKIVEGTGVFHTLIADKLKVKYGLYNRVVKRKCARLLLCNYGVPLHLHQRFLEEMEEMELIKLKDKQNVELLG